MNIFNMKTWLIMLTKILFELRINFWISEHQNCLYQVIIVSPFDSDFSICFIVSNDIDIINLTIIDLIEIMKL